MINSFSDSGAYLFSADTGELLKSLSDSLSGSFEARGGLSLSAGRVLVSSSNENRAYLFDASTGTLKNTFDSPQSFFAVPPAAVAIDGDQVLLGGQGFINGGSEQNDAVSLFDATTGELKRKLLNPSQSFDSFGYPTYDSNSANNFGAFVELDGDLALVGAPLENDSELGLTRSGAAHLFDTRTGELLSTFRSPEPVTTIMGGFGYVGDLDGGRALFGEYLFDATSGALLQTFKLPSLPSGISFQATHAALNGNKALVGGLGINDEDGTLANIGAAFLFDTRTGSLLETFTSPVPNKTAPLFGYRVELDGDNILIGAPSLGLSQEAVDQVFLFKEDETSQEVPESPWLTALGIVAALGLKRHQKP